MAFHNGRHLVNIKGPNGEVKQYVMGICRIIERHPDGTPKTLSNILMKQKVDLEDGNPNEFASVYYPLILHGNEGAG